MRPYVVVGVSAQIGADQFFPLSRSPAAMSPSPDFQGYAALLDLASVGISVVSGARQLVVRLYSAAAAAPDPFLGQVALQWADVLRASRQPLSFPLQPRAAPGPGDSVGGSVELQITPAPSGAPEVPLGAAQIDMGRVEVRARKQWVRCAATLSAAGLRYAPLSDPSTSTVVPLGSIVSVDSCLRSPGVVAPQLFILTITHHDDDAPPSQLPSPSQEDEVQPKSQDDALQAGSQEESEGGAESKPIHTKVAIQTHELLSIWGALLGTPEARSRLAQNDAGSSEALTVSLASIGSSASATPSRSLSHSLSHSHSHSQPHLDSLSSPPPDPDAPRTFGVSLVCARNLKVADPTGYSDPYVLAFHVRDGVRCEAFRSSCKKKTLNPDWSAEGFSVSLRAEDLVEFEVWDHDTLTSHDFLGLARLSYPFHSNGYPFVVDLYLQPRPGASDRNIRGFLSVVFHVDTK